MQDPASWKTIVDVDGWELRILLPNDYGLITDFELIRPSGQRYLGSIGTPEMVRHLLDGADAWNDPFWMSDLILVGELSQGSIEAAVRTLIKRDEVALAMDLADDDHEPDGSDVP